MTLPAQFYAPAAGSAANGAGRDSEFWHGFEDAELSALVERALRENNDLRAALARYDSANALLRLRRDERYPSVTASEQIGRQKLAANQAFGYPRNFRYADSTVNASWEMDFFGRVRHIVEAQRQEVAATRDDIAAMQVEIAGEVANGYVDLRAEQERLRIAKEDTANLEATLKLVQARFSAGRGTEFDVSRASALLEATRSRLPELVTRIATDQHRLAVLCGLDPDALDVELQRTDTIPQVPRSIDPGTPAQVIRRRPDVSAAEARLHEATERIGVTTADLFPRLTFGGLLGLFQYHADSPFDGVSPVNLASLNIDWTFLDRARVRARIDASRADNDAQFAHYQQTVLLALEDVDNALVRYTQSSEQDLHLQRSVQESRHATEIAQARFREGATGLLDLLDAQRVQLQAEEDYLTGRTDAAKAAIGVYKSIAGGWPQSVPSPLRSSRP